MGVVIWPDVGEILAVAFGPPERAIEAADAVPGVAVPAVEIPLDQSVDDEIADSHHQCMLQCEDRGKVGTWQVEDCVW